jgi:hypothetical protein
MALIVKHIFIQKIIRKMINFLKPGHVWFTDVLSLIFVCSFLQFLFTYNRKYSPLVNAIKDSDSGVYCIVCKTFNKCIVSFYRIFTI